MMTNYAIETINVTKIFNRGKPNEVIALNKVSIQVRENSVAVLKGPSGSGKTTLLSLVGCLMSPTSGEVIVKGKKISKLPERFMTRERRRLVGTIFQQLQLIPDMTVLDNILLPLLPEGISAREKRNRAERLLSQLDLEDRSHFKVRTLSGGEQQRVAIARALINNPSVLLADEPSAHLDSRLTNELMEHLGRLKDSGHTILITTHDPKIYEHKLVEQVFEMKDGRIVAA